MLCYMQHYDIDFQTVLTKYASQLQKTVKFNYETLRCCEDEINVTGETLRKIAKISVVKNLAEKCAEKILSPVIGDS